MFSSHSLHSIVKITIGDLHGLPDCSEKCQEIEFLTRDGSMFTLSLFSSASSDGPKLPAMVAELTPGDCVRSRARWYYGHLVCRCLSLREELRYTRQDRKYHSNYRKAAANQLRDARRELNLLGST